MSILPKKATTRVRSPAFAAATRPTSFSMMGCCDSSRESAISIGLTERS